MAQEVGRLRDCIKTATRPGLDLRDFSDQLHSRGAFEAFRRISSTHRWLYTHRGGKWANHHSPEALAFQARFFECFLKGEEKTSTGGSATSHALGEQLAVVRRVAEQQLEATSPA